MQKLIITLILILFNVQSFQTSNVKSIDFAAENLTLKVKIIGVKDGDTVEVLYQKLPFTVRLEHIDAPEKKQDYGAKSKKKLSDLTFGKMVTLISKGKKGNYDRNKRMIAEIYLENGVCANQEMIKSGLAWHYKKYSTQKIYSDLEIIARKNKIGLWKDKNAIAPWNFRGNKKPK